jgi:hypothetical protein
VGQGTFIKTAALHGLVFTMFHNVEFYIEQCVAYDGCLQVCSNDTANCKSNHSFASLEIFTCDVELTVYGYACTGLQRRYSADYSDQGELFSKRLWCCFKSMLIKTT